MNSEIFEIQLLEIKKELAFVKAELRDTKVEMNRLIESRYVQLECLHRLYSIVPNLGPLAPTRGWAASPDFLLKIAEVILNDKPNFMVELGSGVSSLVINACVKLNGAGSAITIDHDKDYLMKTIALVQSSQKQVHIVFEHCPLRKSNIGNEEWQWYDIPSSSITRKIDLLIVDGPPRKIGKNSRFPAIPKLHMYFSDSTKILLDDYNRMDEQEVVSLWIQELMSLGFKVNLLEFFDYEKGLAILELSRIHNNNKNIKNDPLQSPPRYINTGIQETKERFF
jgi:hypothetical protein